MNGGLKIITSSPGMRDTIYVGFAYIEGMFVRIEKASMILRYENGVGIPGLATRPEDATRLRHVPEGQSVYIPITSIAAMVGAVEEKWIGHLGVSRG